jgi:hypothetical protein
MNNAYGQGETDKRESKGISWQVSRKRQNEKQDSVQDHAANGICLGTFQTSRHSMFQTAPLTGTVVSSRTIREVTP